MSSDWENVILLSADALRADHLSCYGYERETSPVLDELAEESIRFTNAYSASSHTREAVPALLTGEYPDVAVDSEYHLASETVASTLSEKGYATAGFHSNPFVSRAYGFDEGFDQFDDDLHLGQHKLIALAQRALDKLRNRHYARAEEINERSLEWVDSLDDDQPFFLWNHYMDTHGPYEPPGEYGRLYADEGLSGRDAQSLYQRAIDHPDSISGEERQLLVDLYDGEIRYNDMRIGEFLDGLQDRGLLENTLLIVTADHGDAFGENGYYEHPRYLHDEITHVPLIVRSPDLEVAEVSQTVSTLDIVSTIENELFGCSEMSLLQDIPSGQTIFSQSRGENGDSHIRRYAGRRSGSVCLCEENIHTSEVSFSDCESNELENRVRSFIHERNRVHQSDTGDSTTQMNSEVENRLDALGYK
ncbi:arylsulfatase [Halorubrum ezzemoulense DSM 17463]|uniref:Arylsulfatase n=1 Tax=Halorubrum ezzemoulense DSM 17463 TaxID=1121945 RepID=A0A1X4G8Q7_HALEZ|nr:sulfatase [Halorubrum ezzemoulense]OSO92991.1 arylsulfatase [Halorubrum ezzemoulense DSM 17463]